MFSPAQIISPAQINKVLLLTAITFGVAASGGSAIAAESQAFSQAGGMAGSAAQMGATTDSGGAMGGMSSTQATSMDSSTQGSTQRASVAAAENSAMMTPLPSQQNDQLSVRNASAISPANNNPTRSSGNITGRPAASSGNGLIESTVKPLADEPIRNASGTTYGGGGTATSTTTNIDQGQSIQATPKAAPTARVPHNKVQYWNQRTTQRTTTTRRTR